MSHPPAQIDEAHLRKLWASNLTMQDIADEFGVDRTTLRTWSRKRNLPQRPNTKSQQYTKPTPDPIPTTTLQDRKDYPQIMAAVARGVKPGVIATWFRLKRGELAGVGR